MLKKRSKILNIFGGKPWKQFTLREIKTLIKSKSESYTYNSLKQFVKEKVLTEERIGNVILYSINKTPKTAVNLALISEYEAWNKKHIPYKPLTKIISKIPTSFFTFIITGSYVKKQQKKDSDIDIVIICDNDVQPKKIYAELRHECEMSIPEIHLYVFTESQFYEMLTNKEENYGKEITKNNLILSGAESYYRIIIEAIRNGFKG